jgi:cell division protein FtsB
MSQLLEQRISELEHKLTLALSQARADHKYTYKLEQWIKLPWYQRLWTPKPLYPVKKLS